MEQRPPKFKAQVLNKSKGILDDFAVRKSMQTKEGTITKTPTENIDIVNKAYVDDEIGEDHPHQDVTTTANPTFATINLTDANTILSQDPVSGKPLRVTSSGKYGYFGCRNTNYCHFGTNATKGFYFYEDIKSPVSILAANFEVPNEFTTSGKFWLDTSAGATMILDAGGLGGTIKGFTTIEDVTAITGLNSVSSIVVNVSSDLFSNNLKCYTGDQITLRGKTANTDLSLAFYGTSNSGIIKWMEDEDWFKFDDAVLFKAPVVHDHRIEENTATLTASSDNYDVATINTLFINPASANVVLGGLTGGVAGQVLHIVITGIAHTTTLENQEGVGDQDIYLCDETDDTLDDYGGWTLVCDGSNWFDCSHAKHV